MKAFVTAVAVTFLVGCATYQPVPDGYTGPVASVADSGFAEGGTKAQLFVLSEVDGNKIPNSFTASAQASYGQGFRLNTRFVERLVPAKTMKVAIRGSHTTGAPIQAMFSQAAGTFFSVEGVVEFTPKADARYIVRGELRKEGSTVWIEDAQTNQPVTEKVTTKK